MTGEGKHCTESEGAGMKEYIERELLLIGVDGCISSLHAQAKGEPIQEGAIKLVEATRDYIASLSAADVAEVRHGHWIDLNAENSTGPLFKCSECSHLHNPNRNDLDLERVELNPLYCDACGARMDKDDEHEIG